MNPARVPLPPAASSPWSLPSHLSLASTHIAAAVDSVCGIVCTDRAGRITWVNSGFERMTGYSYNEVLNRKPGDFLQGPLTALETIARMRAGISSGEGFAVEILNFTRSGADLWVSIECQPQLDPQGGVIGFTAIQTDISARKIAEARTREDRERLAAIVSSAPGVVYEFCRYADGRYAFTYVSPKLREVFGVDSAAALNDASALFSLIEPDEAATFGSSIERSAADLTPWRQVFSIRHPSLGRRWLEGQSSPRRLPEGVTVWSGILWDVTAAERARQQQQVLAGRLQLALHGTAFGVWEFEFASGRLIWDAQMHRLHGIAPADFRETVEHWQSFILPEDLPHVQAAFAQVLDSEFPVFDVAFRIRRTDGHVRFIEGNGILERGADGQPLRAVGMNRDATARHESEQALRQTLREREELKVALERHAKVVVLNARTRVVQVNDRFCRTSGYTRDELIGRDFRLIDTGQQANLLRDMWRTISRGDLWRGDVALRAKSGAVFWVTATVQPLLDDRGTPRQYIVIGSDITHRVQSFRDLKRLSDRLRTALATARMAWWELNLESELLKIDHGDAVAQDGAEAAGISLLPLREWQAAIHPDDREEVERTRQDVLAGRTDEWRCSYRLRNADGDYRWWADIGRISGRDAAGRPNMMEGTTQDIHAERVAFEEHRQLEAKLWEAQRLETVGNFASGISHDFNNLLSGIRGSIQLAQMEEAGTSSQTELMLAALKGCDRARDLVKRILLFARGSTESVRAPVNLPDLLRETLPLIVAAVAHSITTQLRIDGDIPSVSADESQLVQVVMNLAINAAHAMEKTGGKMVLAARTASITPESGTIKGCAPGDYVLLEVSDEGCGMSAAVAERIFEPFFTTKSRGKGSGLGLSVVQRIVNDHGGAITVRSIEGRGTTFEVLLPVMSARSPVAAQLSSPPTWHRRVIVVDDEPLVRDVLLSALRLSKHDTVTFDDALQALAWLENERNGVDLVITDFSMPGMDGLEFSHRLRALRPRIPILVISGNFGAAPKEVRELAYSRILEKPIQLADFERAVNQLLRM